MSGVVQPDRIAREDVQVTLYEYKTKVLSKIKQVKDFKISGSYNSDFSKKDFGDIDLIIRVTADSLQEAKQYLIDEFEKSAYIIPFEYRGKVKKYNNAGELLSIKFKQAGSDKTVQIDNIISLSKTESDFKLNFLNLPAEVQGLVLGLIKVSTDEFPKLKEKYNITGDEAFDVSSSSLRLRNSSNEVIWKSTKWKDVENILKLYELQSSDGFEKILAKCKTLSERSRLRLIGLFKKMISVKSGEVGTPKGDNKIRSIERVEKLVEQRIKGFMEFIRE